MKGMVIKHPAWHPVTEGAGQPAADKGLEPVNFALTKAERAIASTAMAEVLALHGRARFAQPSVAGLDAQELSLSDLTSAELIALAGGDL